MLRTSTCEGRGIGVAVGVNVEVGASVCVGEGVMLGLEEEVIVAAGVNKIKPGLANKQEFRNRSAKAKVRVRLITKLFVDFSNFRLKLIVSLPNISVKRRICNANP